MRHISIRVTILAASDTESYSSDHPRYYTGVIDLVDGIERSILTNETSSKNLYCYILISFVFCRDLSHNSIGALRPNTYLDTGDAYGVLELNLSHNNIGPTITRNDIEVWLPASVKWLTFKDRWFEQSLLLGAPHTYPRSKQASI